MSTNNDNSSKIEVYRAKLGFPVAIICALLVWFMPAQQGLSVAGQKALSLFSAVFILYLTESIPIAITSLCVIPAAAVMKVAPLKVILSGFASSSVFLLLGSFILAVAMTKTGLAERITYIIIKYMGSTSKRITLGIVLANMILAFLVPSSTARTAILLPVCIGIIDLFKHEGRSNFAVALLLILTFTNSTMSSGILTAGVPNPVTVDFLVKAGGEPISYMQWLIYGFPVAFIMTFFTWWYVYRTYTPESEEVPGGREYIVKKLESLGPVKMMEWKALAVFIMVVILWATASITKIDTMVTCLIAVFLLYMPGFGMLTWNDANKGVSWQVPLVAGGGITLGDLLMSTGAAKWIANEIFHMFGLHGVTTLFLLIAVMIIVQYLHFLFVGTTAMTTAIMPIVLAMAQTANIPPVVLALPAGMIMGGYPLLMFYGTLPNLLVYGTGKLKVGDFPRVGVVICGVACILYSLCAVTYWRWLGLF